MIGAGQVWQIASAWVDWIAAGVWIRCTWSSPGTSAAPLITTDGESLASSCPQVQVP